MEHWIISRGLKILSPAEIAIPKYDVQADYSQFMATSIDMNLPFILDKLFQDTVSVRVVEKTITRQYAVRDGKNSKFRKVQSQIKKQSFLLVRNVQDKKCSKKEIMILCAQFISLADCILFATGIPPKLEQLLYRHGIECKHEVHVLSLKDVTFDKLGTRLVPKYVLLNEPEIRELEARKKVTRDQFPRLHATSDAMGRYLMLRPGMVVRTSPTSYRIVVH